MTEGMPASKSTIVFRILEIVFPLQYSPLKSATERDNGMHSSRASAVVSKVPDMNGKAPYDSLFGD